MKVFLPYYSITRNVLYLLRRGKDVSIVSRIQTVTRDSIATTVLHHRFRFFVSLRFANGQQETSTDDMLRTSNVL
jgi:hypothetical protein